MANTQRKDPSWYCAGRFRRWPGRGRPALHRLGKGDRVLGAGCWLLYHFPVRELAGRVLETIRKRDLMKAGDRVAVAVSAGADSVALLLLLLELRQELGMILSVAHVNHKLRGAESDADEQFVGELAHRHKLELVVRAAPVERPRGAGIEAAARELRHEFFGELARTGRAGKIATGHTLDDQAETVLLRIFRGTGIRGLAGILPRLTLGCEGQTWGEAVRPLLGLRRAELREFLQERGQGWREDSSNQDATFLRNKVRLSVLPALRETFGESAVENLADLAEIARAEEEQWAASTQYPVPRTQRRAAALDLSRFRGLPLAVQRRVVRGWIEASAPEVSISFRRIEEILELVRGSAGRKMALPGGRAVRVARGALRWENPVEVAATDYEYVLPVPGIVEIPELGVRIEAVVTSSNDVPEAERFEVLDPGKLRGEMRIRNWRSGDRFWPANTKTEKKVKELLSDRHAVGSEKKLWPVIEVGEELVWMRGFAVPEAWRAAGGVRKVLWIRIKH